MNLLRIFLLCTFVSFLTFITFIPEVSALTVEELQKEIEKKRLEKEKIEEENKRLEAQIQQTNKEAKTLQNEVKSLDTTQKKLQNDVSVTAKNIDTTLLTIQKVGQEIVTSEEKISKNKIALAASLRMVAEADEISSFEILLGYKNLSDAWVAVDALKQFQSSIKEKTDSLAELKNKLESQKIVTERKKVELEGLKGELVTRKHVVDQTKIAKNSLLSKTQSKESEYKKLLAENIERGKKFEQELFNFEAQLKFELDKSKLPTERPGLLSWPLSSVILTQKFGKTVDSGRLYVSGTHNGVDFRASMGTPVMSILSGVVKAVGNTDDQKGCFSYGRWVLVEHPNGLTSLYAHLSASTVSPGQGVSTGQNIGLSGGQPGTSGAGYSTGPHLHLGLFASQGVSVQKYTSSKFCQQVSIPIAGTDAYLDPLAYLPAIN